MEGLGLEHALMYAVFGWALFKFGALSPSCLQCQGKGKHRDDCPFNKDRE